MFLTKKAEDAFTSLLKQAKEIIEGENKFQKIVDLIKDNELQKAVEEVLKLDPVTERVNFYKSDEFLTLNNEDQQDFRNTVDQQDAVKTAIETGTEKSTETEEPKTEEKVEEKVETEETNKEDPLADLFGGEPKEEKPEQQKDAADIEGADLNLVPKASIFDYLHKKAEDVAQSVETTTEEYPLDEQVKSAVRYHIEEGKTKQEAVDSALEECNCVEDVHYKQVAEDAANVAAGAQPQTLGTYTASVQSFLEKAANYKEEGNEFDRICELAKSSSTAYEFLNKVANKLDENTAKQYPGQKIFDDPKNVSFDGGFGVSPQHPGQKILSTKAGGNSVVVTVFPKADKPQVDVYVDKVNRQKVTTINSKDGTIAFMQPIPFEKQTMGEPADYTGFVTGTKLEQFGNPNAAGPVAGAAHKTEKYLDKVYELADKKDVVGKPHATKASSKAGLSKKADDHNDGSTRRDEPDKSIGDSGYPDHIYQAAFPPNKYVLPDGRIDEFAAATTHRISEFGARVIRAIKSGKLDVNVTEEDGVSLLQIAVLRNEELPLIMWLVELGADINHVDNGGFNVLDYAADKDEDVAKYFESLGLEHTQAYFDEKEDDGTDKNASAKSGLSKKADYYQPPEAPDPDEYTQKYKTDSGLTAEVEVYYYGDSSSADDYYEGYTPVDYWITDKSYATIYYGGKPIGCSERVKVNTTTRNLYDYSIELLEEALDDALATEKNPDIVKILDQTSVDDFYEDNTGHTAGFTFHGFQKSASKKKILKRDLSVKAGQSDMYVGTPTHGQSDLSNDSFIGTSSEQTGKHTLTDKEVKEAQELIEKRESQIQCANGFLFHINKVAFDNPNAVEEISDSVDELQQSSQIGHQKVVDSAKHDDFKTFEAQLRRQLMLNKQPNETIEEVKVDQGPAEEYQKQLKPEVENTPNNSDDKSDKKEKSDKDSEKDTETEKDSSGEDKQLEGLEDLLG